jgi:hypothetical protein
MATLWGLSYREMNPIHKSPCSYIFTCQGHLLILSPCRLGFLSMSLEEGMKFQTIAEEQIALEHLYKD